MPSAIYMDNFRGFHNTFVDLKDVNFFVGENSTGKSSVLSLINLLHNQSFWFQCNFNTELFSLGSYLDISDNKVSNFFRIGYIDYSYNKKDNSINLMAIVLHFMNNKGIPYIKEINFIADNKAVRTRILDDDIRVHISTYKENIYDYNQIYKVFVDLCKYNGGLNKGFKIPLKGIYVEPLTIIQYIMSKVHERTADSRYEASNRFYMPSVLIRTRSIWIDPIRSKPKYIYDGIKINVEDKEDSTPYLIRDMLKDRLSKKNIKRHIDNYGINSGMFSDIIVHNYGKENYVPFAIKIKIGEDYYNVTNVGYGVSQILPLIITNAIKRKYCWYQIQQPEIHLHPRAQAAYGSYLYNHIENNNHNKYFIETHSEYIIDRYRYLLKTSKKKIETQVLYFERTKEKNNVYSIPINENGKYKEKQPKNFKEFFINEAIKMMSI